MGARGLLLVLAGTVAAGIGLIGSSTHVLRRPELASVDARFDIRGKQAPPKDVVLVGLDATSLAELGKRPPIPRRLHAQLIDRLREGGAKLIAYDFEFVGPTTTRDDNALIRATRRAGNVLLGTSRVRPGPQTPLDDLAAVMRARVASTNFLAEQQRGGVIRKLAHDELGLPTFSVAAAGGDPDRDRFRGDGAWIDFDGPAETIPALPFSEVLDGRHQDAFAGKVVVVGATALILHDLHPAATGEGMPGSEIQANAIATILEDFPLRDPPGWLAFLLIAGVGAAVPLAAWPLRGLRWLPVPLVLAALYLVAAQLAFDGGTVLPVAAPIAALLAGFLATLAVAYSTDLRERRRLRAAFARFVPPQVVDEVVEQGGAAQERDATVVFCDLRGFTAMAEDMPAERVIELLNRYLTEMSDAILDHGGTVVSYQGDGIMAVFGAPLAQDDHADRALAAAREMVGPRLAAFSAWAGSELVVGIGICSGPVMSGTVGSARRLEYAAVGDTTNTASRLQGMARDEGVSVLVAETTKAALRDGEGGLRFVGELQVRGRGATVRAWTLEPPPG